MRDLIGRRFGRLVAVAPTEQRASGRVVWLCKCDCGRDAYITSSHLLSGHTTSCGCAHHGANREDLTSWRFGRLVALAPVERRLGHSVVWSCRCDCGQVVEVAAVHLKNGSTTSCGCYSREVHQKSFQAAQDVRSSDYVDGTDIKMLMQPPSKANTSGHVGVSWDSSIRAWKAHIQFQGKRYFLGSSRDKDTAIAYRKEAERRIHGEFLEWYRTAGNPGRKKAAEPEE